MLIKRLTGLKPEMGRVLLSAAANNGSAIPSRFPIAQKRDYSTVKTYSKLPKLPVPDPKNTLKHFLEFAQPLQSRQEFEQTKKTVAEFIQKELPTLQKLLTERGEKLNNWLTPWWLNIAYLAARDPLPVVTSPGVLFPHFPFDGVQGQLEYAAKITLAGLQFYQNIINKRLPQDMAGKDPFDMSQYNFLFGTTRVPRKGVDEIVYGIQKENRPRHILVMHHGHAFRVPVLDRNERALSLDQLGQQFEAVLSQSEKRNREPISIVSSDNRDKWAETYEDLERNPRNAANLRAIEDALFVVCLDQPHEPLTGYTEKDEQARQSLHGSGTASNSCNRWFDKTVQFVIGQNGYCGLTYEHTPAEGPPVAMLMDFVCDQIENKDALKVQGVSQVEPVERLEFSLNENNLARIKKSSKKMDMSVFLTSFDKAGYSVVDDIEMVAYSYKRYGKNFPKSVKISPDSFIQMAFQLAFYRIHKSFPPTYETATLRKFDEGRTENIRSPNTAAENFVKKMSKGDVPMADLYDALKTACESHKKYTLACMNGAGMDRHILAWRLIASENNLPVPSIAQTNVFKQMMHFQVSTSQVPTRHFIQMCFGPSAPDCYGICYNPQEKELHFTISTFRHQGSTSSKRYAKELEKALQDMSSVCTKALKEQAKL